MNPRRTVVGALAALALLPGLTAAAEAAPDNPATSATAAAPTATRVVLHVAGCRGCDLTAHSWYSVKDQEKLWSSPTKVVPRSGKVAFSVPPGYSRGLSVQVDAPWAEHVGAVGHLVMAYDGFAPGDPVTVADARAARKGSVCFSGTDAARLDLDVRVFRAHFPGVAGRATAAAAFVRATQPTRDVPFTVTKGFWGTQDAPPCY